MLQARQWIIRCLGWLTFLYCLFGAVFYVWQFFAVSGDWPGSPTLADWALFAALSTVTVGTNGYLGHQALRLARADEAALRSMRMLWWIEILYFCADVVVFWQIMPAAKAPLMVGFFGLAAGPFVPQIVTGYPVIGLIVVSLLSRRHSYKEHIHMTNAEQ